MPNVNVKSVNIQGLLPALDRRVIKDAHVIWGRNFLMDLKGPNTAFGTHLISKMAFNSRSVATFRVEDDIFLLDDVGIWMHDTASDLYYLVFEFASAASQEWPWTYAKVGNNYYFCKLGSGVIQYTPATGAFTILSSNVPTTPYAVCNAIGRLVILGATQVAWSELDVGSNLAPSLTTGAGFQGLGKIGGTPRGLVPLSDGFLTFTTKGVMKSEFTDIDGTPFRHDRMSELLPAISPFCIVQVPDENWVYLTKAGFIKTDGNKKEVWDPVMSDYMKTVLKQFDLSQLPAIKLTCNEEREWFFISFSSDADNEVYDWAFVKYLPTDKWGSFNRKHLAFGELYLNAGPLAGYNFGFLCDNGRMHKFIDFPVIETMPDLNNLVFWQTEFHPPARKDNTVTVFSSYIDMYDFDPSIFLDLTTGLYEIAVLVNSVEPPLNDIVVQFDGTTTDVSGEDWSLGSGSEDYLLIDESDDWGAGPTEGVFSSVMQGSAGLVIYYAKLQPKNLGSIDAEVKIFLTRENMEEFPDQVVMLTDVGVGFDDSPGEVEFEDYLTFPDTTLDYLTASGDEDWGEGLFATNDFDVVLIGTDDGHNTFEDQEKELLVINDNNARRIYASDVNGMWHILHVKALEANQSFHLNLIDASGTMIGRR